MAKEQSLSASFLFLAMATFLGNVVGQDRDPFGMFGMTAEQVRQLTPEELQKINDDLANFHYEQKIRILFTLLPLVLFFATMCICPRQIGRVGAFFLGEHNDQRRDRSDSPDNGNTTDPRPR